jgi:hypothetical protein
MRSHPTPAGPCRFYFALLGACVLCVANGARGQDQDSAGAGQSESSATSDGDTTVETQASAEPSAGTLVAVLEAGLGVTERTIHVPSAPGGLSLDTAFAPALAVRLLARIADESRFLRLQLSYQTSLHMEAGERLSQPTEMAASTTPIRSHRFEAGLAPGLRLGNSSHSPALGLFMGYWLRSFSAVSELRFASFTLHGPMLRLEFELPVASGLFLLRIGPEANLIVARTAMLERQAGLHGLGFAYGGEASVRIVVSDLISLRLSYRESRAQIRSVLQANLEDVERYLLLDALFRYY